MAAPSCLESIGRPGHLLVDLDGEDARRPRLLHERCAISTLVQRDAAGVEHLILEDLGLVLVVAGTYFSNRRAAPDFILL